VTIPIYVEICGYQSIWPTDAEIFLFQQNLQGQDNLSLDMFLLFEMNTTTSLCQINSFVLKDSDGTSPLPASLATLISLNGTHINVSENTPYDTTFVLEAISDGGPSA
jgi:hypothetical protein